MSSQKDAFIIEDYGKKSTFASFLPGIAGRKGRSVFLTVSAMKI